MFTQDAIEFGRKANKTEQHTIMDASKETTQTVEVEEDTNAEVSKRVSQLNIDRTADSKSA